MKTKHLIAALLTIMCFSYCTSSANKKNKKSEVLVSWHNPISESNNVIQGRYWCNELKGTYARLPQRIKDSVRVPLWNLAQNSAGLSLKFNTNATKITVRYIAKGAKSMPHMPATGVSGVDLYANINGTQAWCKGSWHYNADTVTYTYNGISSDSNINFTLYLPLYTSVETLEIGIDSDKSFKFLDADNQKPIVCYGTSITQGACASRPAMAWTNMLQRQLNMPLVNLGFSGNGQLEKPLFDMLSEIDAAAYIIDCLPNMTNDRTKLIYQRTIDGVEKIRTKSNAPIILAEHCGYMNNLSSKEALQSYTNANKELLRAYTELKNKGVENLHYITTQEFAFTSDSQVDGVHPNDLGMQQYANTYEAHIRKILKLTK